MNTSTSTRARHIREILAEMREERAREKLAALCCKLFFAHLLIVTIYFFAAKP